MSKDTHEQTPQPQTTAQGTIELEESQLVQARGGAGYIKFDGIDGEVLEKRVSRLGASTITQK